MLTEEAKRISEEAERRGLTLRIISAIAAELHSPKYAYLLNEMHRPPHKDIDLVTLPRFRKDLKRFFLGMNYKPLEQMLVLYGQARHTYNRDDGEIEVDVYFGKLEYCHRIDLTARLQLDRPTITPSDILLQKMQIVKPNEKDVIDATVLLREHEVQMAEGDVINAKYISSLLSDDWGFYYTFSRNLSEVKAAATQSEVLTQDDKKDVCSKVEKLISCIEGEPKSLRWKTRLVVGTKKKWYMDVEDLPSDSASSISTTS
jgi:hypothetical protein